MKSAFFTLKFMKLKLLPSSCHFCIFPINNSTFTSQYPLTTHTTSAISNYNLPTPTVTYFQLTILHLHLSIYWPITKYLSCPFIIFLLTPLPLTVLTEIIQLISYDSIAIISCHRFICLLRMKICECTFWVPSRKWWKRLLDSSGPYVLKQQIGSQCTDFLYIWFFNVSKLYGKNSSNIKILHYNSTFHEDRYMYIYDVSMIGCVRLT